MRDRIVDTVEELQMKVKSNMKTLSSELDLSSRFHSIDALKLEGFLSKQTIKQKMIIKQRTVRYKINVIVKPDVVKNKFDVERGIF